ncbi:MAG: ASKHA domain-containing protein [bacterium]|nr:ASKHA domain-containing protein [bacterium]
MKRYQVTFFPNKLNIEVPENENILKAAQMAGVYVSASCGGETTCGKCKIVIKEGIVETENTGKLSQEEIDRGYYLACATKIKSDLDVLIPVESRISDREILEKKKELLLYPESLKHLIKDWTLKPIVQKYFLELLAPDLQNNLNDLDRLLLFLEKEHKLKDIEVDFLVVERLSKVFRQDGFKVTVTILYAVKQIKLIYIEPGDTTKEHYSIALDIGTTSVYGQLIDLNKGRVVSQSSDYNAQISCGEDVITRIVYALKGKGAEELQGLVVKTINKIVIELLKDTEIEGDKVSHIVVSGNTTMIHLLLNVDPRYIREAPYVPTFNSLGPLKTLDFNLDINNYAYMYLMPSVASYIGGDITSGILGTGIYDEDKLTLYIDVGTNGEIVLGNKEMLLSASCSAGPAFEGGTIKHGMRATKGAIEEVYIDKTLEPKLVTIGKEKPKGICGTGLINIVAELLEKGVIDQGGKFHQGLGSNRIRKEGNFYEYVLCFAKDSAIDRDIVITEVDIDNLIRAKGAMYAGMSVLVAYIGISFADISRVIIAGNLGENIDIKRAITIGFLPELPLDRFTFVGNGSLLGARLFSLSQEKSKKAYEIASHMINFELSSYNKFMDEYMAALFIPHTNDTRFPEVMKRIKI